MSMTSTTVCHGPWRLSRPHLAGPFTAHDTRTGITHDTGATTIQEAYAFADAFDGKDTTAPAAHRYTVEQGSRARAGHQRYRGGEERTA